MKFLQNRSIANINQLVGLTILFMVFCCNLANQVSSETVGEIEEVENNGINAFGALGGPRKCRDGFFWSKTSRKCVKGWNWATTPASGSEAAEVECEPGFVNMDGRCAELVWAEEFVESRSLGAAAAAATAVKCPPGSVKGQDEQCRPVVNLRNGLLIQTSTNCPEGYVLLPNGKCIKTFSRQANFRSLGAVAAAASAVKCPPGSVKGQDEQCRPVINLRSGDSKSIGASASLACTPPAIRGNDNVCREPVNLK